MKTTAINNEDRSVSEMYQEGIRYFMGEGRLNSTLRQLAADLDSHNIDYVVIGSMALFAHKYPRFTEDIEVVVSAEGLEKFQKEIFGTGGWGMFGYLRPQHLTGRSGRRTGIDQDAHATIRICQPARSLCAPSF